MAKNKNILRKTMLNLTKLFITLCHYPIPLKTRNFINILMKSKTEQIWGLYTLQLQKYSKKCFIYVNKQRGTN